MTSDFQTLPTIVKLNPLDNLQIIRADITRDLKLAIDLLNISDKIIKDVKFSVVYKDAYDNYLFNGSEFIYYSKDLNIQPHTVYYVEPFDIDERFKDARSIVIYIQSLTFDDGRLKEYSNKDAKEFTLPVITFKKLEKIKSILGPEIFTYGENLIDGWRCVCGATNEKDAQECRNCGRNKNFVLNNLTEPLINIKLLNNISNSGEINNVNQEILASNLTQTQLTKIAPEAEELEDKRINSQEIIPVNHRKTGKTIMKSIISILTIIIIAVICFFAFKFIRQININHRIESAKSYIVAGNYGKALEIYESINNKNTDLLSEIEKTRKLLNSKESYEEGNKLMSEGEYLKAVKAFKAVIPEDAINFSTSQDKISELEDIILNKANEEFIVGNKQGALDMINEFLKIVPESANATTLKDTILKNKSDNKTLEQKINESLEEGLETDKSRAEITKKAENLLNTYQKVRTDKANLRKSPSTDSEIITVLPPDSDLYIKDTKIEGEKRIWCKVEAKDANTKVVYSGWVSNKVMED